MTIKETLLNELKGNFLATGVGSLPHTEARPALDLVFGSFGFHIPFWPQLPKRSFLENMYVQFGGGLPGLKIDEAAKSVWVDTQDAAYLGQLEECFNKTQAADVDHFAISRESAEGLHFFAQRLKGMNWQGWVKAQVIGPLSLGLTLLDERRNPILYNAELAELLPILLSLKAAWLIRTLRVHARTKIIIFIDEPYLVAVGTASMSLPRADIIEKINQVARVIHADGALCGIHCCGNTDWEMLMETDVDIVNFDAFGYLDKVLLYEKVFASFAKRGGIPAIGIIPTAGEALVPDIVSKSVETLMKHPALLKSGALITTSCGCSGLTEELARFAHEACAQVAERLRAEF